MNENLLLFSLRINLKSGAGAIELDSVLPNHYLE